MKIALVSIVKPQEGSGDGPTEYAFRLYEQIRKRNDVSLIYSLGASRSGNVAGLIYTNTLFRSKIKALAGDGYDIIHVTNQELGFAAKIVKVMGSSAMVVTTIHDLMRIVGKEFHRGVVQQSYNFLVGSSIEAAVKYSDRVIFPSSRVAGEAAELFRGAKNFSTIPLAARDSLLKAAPKKRHLGRSLTVGYFGGFSKPKNVGFILRTALSLKSKGGFTFKLYGAGQETTRLSAYKTSRRLSNVYLMGSVPEGKLLSMYDSFDVFMYPSLKEGPAPQVLDALARGLPVVVVKGNLLDKEIAEHCIVANSERHAAEILMRLRQKGYEERLRQKGLRFARGRSWRDVAEETLNVYKILK
jgi:glycosyltransferase involved in cell wall biosynthesis